MPTWEIAFREDTRMDELDSAAEKWMSNILAVIKLRD